MESSSSTQRVGIFILLFSVLLLPMLHRHPSYYHRNGETEGHQHHSTVHANFFPETAYGEENKHDHDDQDRKATEVSFNPSEHTLSQISLLSLHIGQSFQLSSFFKKNLNALDQGSLDLSSALHFQRAALIRQQTSPFQTPQISPPSLRAPPHFA